MPLWLRRCKKLVNAEKSFTIHEAPMVLTIHLKRFTPSGRKIGDSIKYPELLQLGPYMSDVRSSLLLPSSPALTLFLDVAAHDQPYVPPLRDHQPLWRRTSLGSLHGARQVGRRRVVPHERLVRLSHARREASSQRSNGVRPLLRSRSRFGARERHPRWDQVDERRVDDEWEWKEGEGE